MRIANRKYPSKNNTDGYLVDRRALHRLCEKEGGQIYLDYQKWVSGQYPNRTLVLCRSQYSIGADTISNDFPFVIMYTNDLELIINLNYQLDKQMRVKGVLERLRKKYPQFSFYMGTR